MLGENQKGSACDLSMLPNLALSRAVNNSVSIRIKFDVQNIK